MSELISVLMPTYNVENYVEDAVRSILIQSYSNFELIVVDDCSTDNTFNILKTLSKLDCRIKLFRNSKNIKIVETLNFAITKAKGLYIARMDGDDISYPNRLEILYKYLKDHTDIDLVGSQMETINENGVSLGYSSCPINEDNVVFGLKFRMSTVSHIWLAKRSVYDTLKEYRIPSAEDYDFLLRLVTHGVRFTNVPECLYKVRIRNGNTATTYGLKQRLAANYSYKLYRYRVANKINHDKFNINELNNIFSKNLFSLFLYKKSNIFLNCALNYRNKSKIKFCLFICLSLLLSPYYQTQLLYNRFRIKKLK